MNALIVKKIIANDGKRRKWAWLAATVCELCIDFFAVNSRKCEIAVRSCSSQQKLLSKQLL